MAIDFLSKLKMQKITIPLAFILVFAFGESLATNVPNTSSSLLTESLSGPNSPGERGNTVERDLNDNVTSESASEAHQKSIHDHPPQNMSTTKNNTTNRNKTHEKINDNTSNEQNINAHMNRSSYAKSRDDDEQTYLDLFGERAKEILTQHIIPSTDSECRWDWRMGRCEPYCECGIQFLWGDYHLGRSCRRRPPPLEEEKTSGTSGETSWEEAWQEVTERMESPEFFSTLFMNNNDDLKTSDAESSDGEKSCTLPPESRYIQIIQQLTSVLSHSTVVLKQFQKFQHATIKMLLLAKAQGEEHFTVARQQACQTIKMKMEEREKQRKQQLVLTRRGMIWIRRLCGTGSTVGAMDVFDEELQDVSPTVSAFDQEIVRESK